MAKKFRFRLETVLKLRRLKEDEHKRVVGERLRHVGRCRERVSLLTTQIASAVGQSQSAGKHKELDVQFMSRQRFWISRLQRHVLETELEIHEVRDKLAEDRRLLVEASREVKVLEKLREKALHRYAQELNRQETLDADEAATQLYIRRQKGSLR